MMISWVLVLTEILALFAVFHFLDGKKSEKTVLIGFSILSVVIGCLALYLAEEASTLMRALCFAVPLSSVLRLERIPKKRHR